MKTLAVSLLIVGEDPATVDATPIEIHPGRCGFFDLKSDPASIQMIEYSGGCADHSFTLHAGDCFLESWPPQSEIFLAHTDPEDPCDAVVTDERVFDLVPLKETYLADPGGRSRTLVLRIHEPDSQQHYEPKPLYDAAPDRRILTETSNHAR